MSDTVDNVPTDLARLKAALLASGWVVTGATYTHPDAPGVRLNTAYTYREATLSVATLPNVEEDKPVWRVVAFYRGTDPIMFALEHVVKVAPKLFAGLADNLNNPA